MIKSLVKAMLVVLVILLFIPGGGESAETIRLANYEAPPFASESLPGGGVMCRIVAEAFSRHGIAVSIRWYPVKRAYRNVKEGHADASLGWMKNPDRERAVIFSDEPLAASSIVCFFRKGKSFDWRSIDDFKGLRIGAKVGALAYGNSFLEAERTGELRVHRVPTDEQNLRKLLSGRIDVMLGSPILIQTLLRTRFTPEQQAQIVAHPKPLSEQRFYAIFNKRLSPRSIEAFNDEIRQLRESGQFSQWVKEALEE